VERSGPRYGQTLRWRLAVIAYYLFLLLRPELIGCVISTIGRWGLIDAEWNRCELETLVAGVRLKRIVGNLERETLLPVCTKPEDESGMA
jgi:hypothetical protein